MHEKGRLWPKTDLVTASFRFLSIWVSLIIKGNTVQVSTTYFGTYVAQYRHRVNSTLDCSFPEACFLEQVNRIFLQYGCHLKGNLSIRWERILNLF